MLSINDYPMAQLGDRAGLDTILVGDSLAITVLGYETTIPVTVEEMLHHTKAVKRAFVIGDMLFMSNTIVEDAVRNAGRFLKEGGTDAVKVEGGRGVAPIINAILSAGIPVMGHIELTPQSSSMLGGFKVQGSDAKKQRRLSMTPLRLKTLAPLRLYSNVFRTRCRISLRNDLKFQRSAMALGLVATVKVS